MAVKLNDEVKTRKSVNVEHIRRRITIIRLSLNDAKDNHNQA